MCNEWNGSVIIVLLVHYYFQMETHGLVSGLLVGLLVGLLAWLICSLA
jgi:Na+/proline symporter